jgi:uncharacterized membrane protein
MNKSENSITLKSLVQIAMLTALVFVTTYIIQIPTPGNGYVNAGDCMVFMSAVLLGGKKGAIASALGGSLSDVLGGYLMWSPFTFVIKAVMALIVGVIIYKFNTDRKNIFINGIAFIMAGIWEVIAYFGAGVIIYMLTVSKNVNVAVLKSILDIPGNIAQATVGLVIAVPFTLLLTKSGLLYKFKSANIFSK